MSLVIFCAVQINITTQIDGVHTESRFGIDGGAGNGDRSIHSVLLLLAAAIAYGTATA